MRLFYFTSAKYGLAAIRDQRYKLSTFSNLNDPFELFAADLADPLIREAFYRFKRMHSEEVAILCCSKGWGSTLLWSHYADNHKGLALQPDVKDEAVDHISYCEDRVPISTKDMDDLMHAVDGKSALSTLWNKKARDWAYEEEARIYHGIAHLKRPVGGLIFAPFNDVVSLTGVILGPLCTTTSTDIQKILPSGKALSVIKARMAFRQFRITRDLSYKAKNLVEPVAGFWKPSGSGHVPIVAPIPAARQGRVGAQD